MCSLLVNKYIVKQFDNTIVNFIIKFNQFLNFFIIKCLIIYTLFSMKIILFLKKFSIFKYIIILTKKQILFF